VDKGRTKALSEFVAWTKAHITGDEKGEAQLFLDRLFRAFGQPGLLEIGGKTEFRIKRADQDAGGTRFADYVWKPVVLIEMKKRGADLAKHVAQAFAYWTDLAPGRPRYVVLCNFDELWIYDPEESTYEPADKVRTEELPAHYEALAFLFPTREAPRFRYNRVAVTRTAAGLLATCFGKLAMRRDVGRERAQRFILQMLIALFSEDIDLLPKGFVSDLLDECTDPPKAFDLLGGLFRAMATREGARGGRFREVPYFNGGIFSEPAPVELAEDEVAQLRSAAKENWALVNPDIFGTLFQRSMDAGERHRFGGHYTSAIDIMKIVRPTIVEPWLHFIENASTLEELGQLRARLHTFRVLDPACGSGNFLYIAYRELKRIEARLLERIREKSRKGAGQAEIGFVTTKQFFGMDIIPFAVELAKVTLTIGHKLAIDEFHSEEKPLPLDNLDANITCTDALIRLEDSEAGFRADNAERTPWPKADVIIGNPPFLGAKKLKPERGADYVNALRKMYPEVPGMADYCVYWFRRAHDHLEEATAEEPLRGRAGLVGTQNIRNNQSRVGGLDHIVKSGTIVEAVDNQPWSGEANVHVSIANWVKHAPPAKSGGRISIALEGTLGLPPKRRLWFKVEPEPELFVNPSSRKPSQPIVLTRGKRGGMRRDKSYELGFRDCDILNSALSDQAPVGLARVLRCNAKPQRVFQGVTPGHKGFVLSPSEAKRLLQRDPTSKLVLVPYLVGRELVTGESKPRRFLIDFADRDLHSASQYAGAFHHVEEKVLPTMREKAEKEGDSESVRKDHLQRWWKHWRGRGEMRDGFARLRKRYIACSRVTKRPVFVFVGKDVRPGDALFTFAFDDDYSFGILQADQHWRWFAAKCSKLKSDFRYTPESVFDTFPWPQSPTRVQVRTIADKARAVRAARAELLAKTKGGLRAMYRTLELEGDSPLRDAHAWLDAAVLDAYGFNPKRDLLAQLLALNLEVAAREDKGEAVTGPGVPKSYGDPADLITEDCIKP